MFGRVLAEPLTALTDLPSFDSSAMDGWAVSGPGPWRLVTAGPGVLAGDDGLLPLEDGEAVPVATGARVPPGTTGVLRSEYGEVRGRPAPGNDGRERGEHRPDRHPGDRPEGREAPGARGTSGGVPTAQDPTAQDPTAQDPTAQDSDVRASDVRDPDAPDPAGPENVAGPEDPAGRAASAHPATATATATATGHGRSGPAANSPSPYPDPPTWPPDPHAPGTGTPGATGSAPTPAPTPRLHAAPGRTVTPGQDVRPRGQECRSGDRLLAPGAPVTPAVLGLAAAAGYDALPTVRRPRVEVLVLGSELLHAGLPREGRIRDALGPMLGPWLTALGAEVTGVRRLGDDAAVLYAAVTGSTADLVVTTGGTAAGPVDHVHPVLRRAGAEVLVDGVAVRPGHPMLLARLAPDRHLVGLPGNPLAAVSALLTLVEPLLRTLSGSGPRPAASARLAEAVQGHPRDVRLVPVAYRSAAPRHRPAPGPRGAGTPDAAVPDGDRRAVPLRFGGPAMLRGIAAADGLAVVPPGGADAGTAVEILRLPWAEGEAQ
ncbi:molybdopterin molybdotransferase MoeA [Streptomyces zingiberis]|uniref:molybdopterin molybdotransferase MoeA n=1 Tax=Streptomyces zingiberis TaxID=2053010 RepID=UPI00289380F5|nr:molybdopterin-binding protein [Streptomyces zingiberis]